MRQSPEGNDTEPTLADLHHQRLVWLEETTGHVLALPTEYPSGYHIPPHHHSRAQLIHALTGVMTVATDTGRWMVPPEYALWIPAGVEHSTEMQGTVRMQSIYVSPQAIDGLPTNLRVLGLTPLMRSLIVEAATVPANPAPTSRDGLLMDLLLQEILRLPEQPLGLPLPTEPRLAERCRRFVAEPSPHATIEEWATELAMSRRTFTRAFRRETGLSFALWRQQVCLFAALPRLAGGEAVTTVARELGYESAAAFTTMFKRMLGTAPRNYLRSNPASK